MCDLGWEYVSEEGEYFYDQSSGDFKRFLVNGDTEPDYDFAKSCLQVLYEDFLSK